MTAFGCKLLLCLTYLLHIRAIPDWRRILFKTRYKPQHAAFLLIPAGGPWCPGRPCQAPAFHGEAAAPGDCSAGSPARCLMLQHHRPLKSSWQLTGTHKKMLPPKAATTKPPFRSMAATAGLYGSTAREKDHLFKPTLLRRNTASLVGNLSSWRRQWKTSTEEKKGVLLCKEQRKRLCFTIARILECIT